MEVVPCKLSWRWEKVAPAITATGMGILKGRVHTCAVGACFAHPFIQCRCWAPGWVLAVC